MSLRDHAEQLKKSAVDAVSHNIKTRKWETYKQFKAGLISASEALRRIDELEKLDPKRKGA